MNSIRNGLAQKYPHVAHKAKELDQKQTKKDLQDAAKHNNPERYEVDRTASVKLTKEDLEAMAHWENKADKD